MIMILRISNLKDYQLLYVMYIYIYIFHLAPHIIPRLLIYSLYPVLQGVIAPPPTTTRTF